MSDLSSLETLLEQHRRSLAMLPPGSPLTREAALRLVEHCQSVVAAARSGIGGPP